MAEQFANLALNGVPALLNNYDTIYERSKRTVKKIPIPGRKNKRGEQEYYEEVTDDYGPPRRSQTERQRPKRYYDEDDDNGDSRDQS